MHMTGIRLIGELIGSLGLEADGFIVLNGNGSISAIINLLWIHNS